MCSFPATCLPGRVIRLHSLRWVSGFCFANSCARKREAALSKLGSFCLSTIVRQTTYSELGWFLLLFSSTYVCKCWKRCGKLSFAHIGCQPSWQTE